MGLELRQELRLSQQLVMTPQLQQALRLLQLSRAEMADMLQDELLEKFGVTFDIFSREKQEQCASGNYFDESDQLICRLDQLSRNEEFQNHAGMSDCNSGAGTGPVGLRPCEGRDRSPIQGR